MLLPGLTAGGGGSFAQDRKGLLEAAQLVPEDSAELSALPQARAGFGVDTQYVSQQGFPCGGKVQEKAGLHLVCTPPLLPSRLSCVSKMEEKLACTLYILVTPSIFWSQFFSRKIREMKFITCFRTSREFLSENLSYN